MQLYWVLYCAQVMEKLGTAKAAPEVLFPWVYDSKLVPVTFIASFSGTFN